MSVFDLNNDDSIFSLSQNASTQFSALLNLPGMFMFMS